MGMVKNIRRIANHHINQASFVCQIMLMLIIMAITGKVVAQQTVALSQAIPDDQIVEVVNE
jgi:peptidyl-prolyl cis-trans isomerase SurA